MQALYDQITETLTAEQVQAIGNMSFTQEVMATLVNKYGGRQIQAGLSTSTGRGSASAASSFNGL